MAMKNIMPKDGRKKLPMETYKHLYMHAKRLSAHITECRNSGLISQKDTPIILVNVV